MSEQPFPTQLQQNPDLGFPQGTALQTGFPVQGGGTLAPQFTEPSRVANSENARPTQINAGTATTQGPETGPVMTSAVSNPSNVADGASSSSGRGGGGSNLSSGAVAGVAIGCLIIGAVLAFAAAFLIFKRRNNKKIAKGTVSGYDAFADSTPELVMSQKNIGRNSAYVQVSQMPHSQHTSMTAVATMPMQHQQQQQPNASTDLLAAAADILPAAAHESEIQSGVTGLFAQMHRHVETYYRDVHASITPSMESDLARFGASGVDMATLLQDVSSPVTALKHALVAYVISITSPKEGDECVETLFPEELNTAQLAIASEDSSHNLSKAALLHRRLSVYLYNATSSTSTSRRYSTLPSDLREAAEHFSLTFFPWANPSSSDQEKDDDLARIIADVLQMRIWLFGQPGEYAFRWEEVGRRGVVVAPKLVVTRPAGGNGCAEEREEVVCEGGVVGW